MTDLDRLLDDYPVLSPDERADADRQLSADPARAVEWAGARRLAELLDAARPEPRDDLARRAVARRMRGDRPGNPSSDPEEAIVEAWLDQIEAQAEDPVARFERMTGRALARPVDRTEAEGSPVSARPFVAASPQRSRRRARLVTAGAVVLAMYVGLWGVSATLATPRDQLADLGSIEAQAPPALLGAEAIASAEPLSDALRTVRSARRSALPLFPRYDPSALDAAAVQLTEVADDADGWVSQEARLALARVHLARQRDLEAARVLGGLVREGGYRAPVARRLLDAIRAGLG